MQSQLFQRAENGDTLAQAELFRLHYTQTYRLADSLLSQHEDAEEVFILIWEMKPCGDLMWKRPCLT